VCSFAASTPSVGTSPTSVASNVELGQHEDQRARKEARTQWLAEHGFRLLRYSDREALMQTEAVLAEIQNRL